MSAELLAIGILKEDSENNFITKVNIVVKTF